jgi:hypothetical protein
MKAEDKQMLSGISKKIIKERLYDKGIKVNEYDLDTILIDPNDFESLNDMYESIVNNWGKLFIN